MHKETKATGIPQSVKRLVFNRDGGRCVLCGAQGAPNAHYVPRSHGGRGIEKNIITLCCNCHRRYDQTADRSWIRNYLRCYLRSHYENWNEQELIYKKGT